MTWSAGHVWFVNVPVAQIKKEAADEKFEFKFVVKQSDDGGRSLFVSKWEGCTINHCYDGNFIKKNL